jgi:hypothetical protein
MTVRRLPWLALFLVPLAGCGPKPTPPQPSALAPVVPDETPLIKPVPVTADDWKEAKPFNLPPSARGGKTDEQLARELDMEAFAFEYRNGPMQWWMEVQEVGQTTVISRRGRPAAVFDHVTPPEGRLVVSIGRWPAERMKEAMQVSSDDASLESVGFRFCVRGSLANANQSFGTNPLWFGWPGDKVVKATAATVETAKPGDVVTVLTLTCEEPKPADMAKPKKVTLTLKAKFVGDGK